MDENSIKLIQIYQLFKNSPSPSIVIYSKFEEILENNFSINHKLSFEIGKDYNVPQYSGNTALHFWAEFGNSNCPCKICKNYLDLFVKHNADFSIQNDNGYSPLLLSFLNGLQIDDLLLIYIEKKKFANLKDKNGISHFHAACSTQQVSAVDVYLENGCSVDERVNENSPKYPGFTPLHFAAQNGQFQVIELLLANSADLNSKDVNGITPLHLLIKKCKEPNFDCKFFLKIFPLTFLPDEVGLTNLHINCTMNYGSLFKRLLSQDIDVDFPIKFDSPVWPGLTPLHLASQFNLPTVIRLLEKGANLLAKDANGISPLDLCLKQYSLDEIIQILSTEKRHCLSRIKFTDGTYLLDVLRLLKNVNKFEQFMKAKIKNVNTVIPFDSLIWPGYNLLHLAITFGLCVDTLLSCNIDFTMINADGRSPLHLAFYLEKKQIVQSILNLHEKIAANPIDRDFISHFHIACAARDLEAVKFLLSNGSNPNLPAQKDIQCNFYEPYLYKSGTTPFDIAVSWINVNLRDKIPSSEINLDTSESRFLINFSFDEDISCHDNSDDNLCKIMMSVRLKRGMKVLMTKKMSLAILDNVITDHYESHKVYVKVIDKLLKEKRYEELGLTRLQVACALGKLLIVRNELKSGANVNQQIAFDSDLWPGDTALHINSRRKEFRSRTSRIKIAELLLAHGANPNLKNANNLTPVHLSKDTELKTVLLSSNEKVSSENPANNDGLSHFHLSCQTSNLLLVKKFLKSRVNVNTFVNYFADCDAGYTPLHFAVQYSTKEIIELLLSHGANPNIKAANGLTPFYLAVTHNVNQDRIEALLRSPVVDIQSTDITGKPVLIKALNNISDVIEEGDFESFDANERKINLLLKKGAHMDLACITADKIEFAKFSKVIPHLSISTWCQLIKNISNITDVDKHGRNIMHFIDLHETTNAPYFFENLNTLVQSGCDINHKSNNGQTPLHKAAIFGCDTTASLLLALGADINIMDDEGRTPLFYASQKRNASDSSSDYSMESDDDSDLVFNLLCHVTILKKVGLYVDEYNEECLDDYFIRRESSRETLLEMPKLDKKLKKCNLSFSVEYFFTEQFEVDYKKMSVLQRRAICSICDSDNLNKEFPKLHNLIRLQFRKARSRIRLLQPATDAFRNLVGQAIPELCIESILKYLNNDSLMNLVRSGNEKLIFGPLLEYY